MYMNTTCVEPPSLRSKPVADEGRILCNRACHSFTILGLEHAPNVSERKLGGSLYSFAWMKRIFIVYNHEATLEATELIMNDRLGLSYSRPPSAQGCGTGSGANISFPSAPGAPTGAPNEHVSAINLNKDSVGDHALCGPHLHVEFNGTTHTECVEKLLTITRIHPQQAHPKEDYEKIRRLRTGSLAGNTFLLRPTENQPLFIWVTRPYAGDLKDVMMVGTATPIQGTTKYFEQSVWCDSKCSQTSYDVTLVQLEVLFHIDVRKNNFKSVEKPGEPNRNLRRWPCCRRWTIVEQTFCNHCDEKIAVLLLPNGRLYYPHDGAYVCELGPQAEKRIQFLTSFVLHTT